MLTIWKYSLSRNYGKEVISELPSGARFLSAQVQQEVPVLWFLVDPDAPRRSRAIIQLATGGQVPSLHEWRYLGTVQTNQGYEVRHIFIST